MLFISFTWIRDGDGVPKRNLVKEMKSMASDPSVGLHYSGDVTEEIRDPLINLHQPPRPAGWPTLGAWRNGFRDAGRNCPH